MKGSILPFVKSFTRVGRRRVIKAPKPQCWRAAFVRLTAGPGGELYEGTKKRDRVVCEAAGEDTKQSQIEQPASMQQQQQLSRKDKHMVRLYLAGCFHKWDQLPDIAREFLAAGCTAEELRACVRHLIVFAGYGPCLAATLTLHKAELLPEDTPAKIGGPPGNAFELVYGNVTDLVRKKMHAADPALGEWIRLHLYGDVYSSPGLDLRQKQLLACGFLGVANMPDQLFGHAVAGLRFGNSKAELEEAVRLGFHMAPATPDGCKEEALKMLDMAWAKYEKDFADEHSPAAVTVPDPSSVRVPPLPPPYKAPGSSARGGAAGSMEGSQDATVTVALGGGQSRRKSSLKGAGARPGRTSLNVEWEGVQELPVEEPSDDIVFAWEEIDPRFDKSSRAGR